MKFSIRKASKKDLQSLLDLNEDLFTFETHFDDSLKPTWAQSAFGKGFISRFIRKEERVIFIAEAKGNQIGFIAGRKVTSPKFRKHWEFFQLSILFVSEKYRSSGVGQALYDEFFTWAKSKGAERIKVSALAENANAVSFYKKNSFKPYLLTLEQDVD